VTESGTRPGVAAATLGPVISAQTWLAVIHLLTGLFLGSLVFVLVVTFAAAGVGLVVVFLSGILVLAATLWLCAQFGRAERARFALMLGRLIPAPVPPAATLTGWRRLWRITWSSPTWRQFGYALLRLPLSVVQVCVLLVVWAAALALITLPAYSFALPRGGPVLGGQVVRGPGQLAGAVVVGLLVLLAAPWVTQALALLDGAVAGRLLGPGRRADLTARIGELETSRAQVVDAAEHERRRIERDLHDGAQQRLISLGAALNRARTALPNDPARAAETLDTALATLDEAAIELRNLARGIHPSSLTRHGLAAALADIARRSPVELSMNTLPTYRFPASIEATAYFVVSEALTNVAKHAGNERARVALTITDLVTGGRSLEVTVADEGTGGASVTSGSGLQGLADRVALLDGTFDVVSPHGRGTLVRARIPLP